MFISLCRVYYSTKLFCFKSVAHSFIYSYIRHFLLLFFLTCNFYLLLILKAQQQETMYLKKGIQAYQLLLQVRFPHLSISVS